MQKFARERWKKRQAKYDYIEKVSQDNEE